MSGLCISLGIGQAGWLTQAPAPPVPQPPVLGLAGLAGGAFTISGEAVLTVTVSGGTPQDGSYQVDPALLASGPVNLVPPAIGGTPAVGQTLTATPGLWLYDTAFGAPQVGYQWRADGTNIAGATAASLVLGSAQADTSVTLAETASQTKGTRSALSAAVAVPLPLSLIRQVDGTVVIEASGGLLTVTISGGSQYDGSYQMDPALLATGPVNLVPPVIGGTPAVGETLTLTPGLWLYDGANGAPQIGYQWRANGSAIGGATGTTLVVGATQAGTAISLAETATQTIGSRNTLSASLAIPSAAVLSVGRVGTNFWSLGTTTAAPSFTTDLSELAAGDRLLVFYGSTAYATTCTINGNPAQKISADLTAAGFNAQSTFSYVLQPADISATAAIALAIPASNNQHTLALVRIANGSLGAISAVNRGSAATSLAATPGGSANALVAVVIGVSSNAAEPTFDSQVAKIESEVLPLGSGRLVSLAIGQNPANNTVTAATGSAFLAAMTAVAVQGA